MKPLFGSGGRTRTCDLRVMSPTSYHCSTPLFELQNYIFFVSLRHLS